LGKKFPSLNRYKAEIALVRIVEVCQHLLKFAKLGLEKSSRFGTVEEYKLKAELKNARYYKVKSNCHPEFVYLIIMRLL